MELVERDVSYNENFYMLIMRSLQDILSDPFMYEEERSFYLDRFKYLSLEVGRESRGYLGLVARELDLLVYDLLDSGRFDMAGTIKGLTAYTRSQSLQCEYQGVRTEKYKISA